MLRAAGARLTAYQHPVFVLYLVAPDGAVAPLQGHELIHQFGMATASQE